MKTVLAAEKPELAAKLREEWEAWAARCGVLSWPEFLRARETFREKQKEDR